MVDMLNATNRWLQCAAVLGVVMLLGMSLQNDAHAQFELKWLAAGDVHHPYLSSGHEPECWASSCPAGLQWPAIERARAVNRGNGLWIATKEFTDENGENWPVKTAHVGPRSAGVGEVFPQTFELYNRFPLPLVTVDGLRTFQRAQKLDEVKPDMGPVQMLHTVVNTVTGIEMERNIYQFSQDYHDNYHIREYIFTNTGNTDADAEIELEQTVTDVRILFQDRPQMNPGAGNYYPGSAWGGENNMKDVVNDGMEDYDVPFENHAYYIWAGNSGGADIDPLGGPVRHSGAWFLQDADTVGRLRENWFQGRITLQSNEPKEYPVEEHAGMQNHPTTTAYFSQDDPLTGASNTFDRQRMIQEYDVMMSYGHGPHSADVVDLDGDFTTADGDPALQPLDGVVQMTGYGPYDLEPGESIKIVHGVGVDGISTQMAYHIGKKWKATGYERDAPITHTVNGEELTMTKGQWWYTGRDSLNQTFQRALGAWNNDLNVPQPPKPPKTFDVTSGVDAIELTWTTFDDSQEQGFEIYRAEDYAEGNIKRIFEYEKVADAGPGDGSYRDEDVNRGTEYFYYVVAVGEDRPADPQTMTPAGPLKSSRYWTQTYAPAVLKRSPGQRLSDARVVPNPLNMGSEQTVRFSGQENRLAFLDIPGQSTIKIYTSLGELIKTIEHTDGSGDEVWNLTTSNRQIIASGVYVAVITDNETGEQVIRNFTVVR